jgi:glycosyltransferase involved in cell wall biosynthesis
LLVPENNAPALAEAIAMLINDSEKAENLGKAARNSVQQHFTLKVMSENYIRLLLALYQQNKVSF